mmetsp:Transcript_26084/g.56510  ORF Transcript_26084/g.56510 Transcript_26084/m.56510 type:complete len:167 (-) Transcript_26084:103-603(-)
MASSQNDVPQMRGDVLTQAAATALLVVLFAAILNAIAEAYLMIIYMVALPLLFVFAIQTCPDFESFDSKKELKRVMRGADLPPEQQPQGLLRKGITAVTANVATEAATSLGYETNLYNFLGAFTIATFEYQHCKRTITGSEHSVSGLIWVVAILILSNLLRFYYVT